MPVSHFKNFGFNFLLCNLFTVDGTIIHSDLGTITTINSQFPNLLDTLRRYDIFCGLGEGHVLPNIGKSVEFWQNLNLERFVTAAIKLGLSMDFGTEPSYNLKQVGYHILAQHISNCKFYG